MGETDDEEGFVLHAERDDDEEALDPLAEEEDFEEAFNSYAERDDYEEGFNPLAEIDDYEEGFFSHDEIVVYGEGFIPLRENAFVYIFADVKKMGPIIDVIPVNQLKNWQAALAIDRTEIALVALFTGDTGLYFQIVGFGSYPSLAVTLGLFFHRNWKYVFSRRGNYWSSETDRLSVRFSSKEIYAVSWRRNQPQADPVPQEPGIRMPEGFTAFRHRSGESAPLSLWLDNNNSILDRMFNAEGITTNLPIERLFLNLYHLEDNLFKADLILQARSSALVRNFTTSLSSTGSGSVLNALFFANPPVQNGRNLEFQSALLSETEIVSLMRIFLRNWR
jgi:hypothetical protein